MPDAATAIDHSWASKVIYAVDQAFNGPTDAFAASLRLALMDAHRDPGAPKARQWLNGTQAATVRRLNVLGPSHRDYDLILMAWPAKHRTAIHDHQGTGGFELMLDGQLIVENFVVNNAQALQLLPVNQALLEAGDAEHFGGANYAHRCVNPSASEPALSLHIYTRHLTQCRQFAQDSVGRWSSECFELSSEAPMHAFRSLAAMPHISR